MGHTNLTIDKNPLNPEEIIKNLLSNGKLFLGEEARKKVRSCRQFLENTTSRGAIHYGINTGFGHLCDVLIKPDQLEQLQENLLISHACGTGDFIPDHISRIMLLLKIKNLSLGHSGVREELLDFMVDMFNSGAAPEVYEQGSLGASGDLAPLAHLCLPLIGKGRLNWKGAKWEASKWLSKIGREPIRLASKEGLALINGTQFSSGFGLDAVVRSKLLLKLANLNAALSMEAFNTHLSPFHPQIHQLRPHEGQMVVSAEILNWLMGSDIGSRKKYSVQDPYSFRCIPQVHGASYDNIKYVYSIIETEINSVSDNPLIFPEEGLILSGGNFHAQPVGMAMDHLALAVCELASISERRIYQLINGHRELPICLIEDAGMNSGLMILQYSAASVVSLNKQLASPSTVDSIISSMGQEDHVSMAANAATKSWKIVNNSFNVLAMEFLTAMQALDFRKDCELSNELRRIKKDYREIIPYMKTDRVISEDLEKTKVFLNRLLENWLMNDAI